MRSSHTTVDPRLLGYQAHAIVAVLTLGNNPLAEQLGPRLLVLDGVKDLALFLHGGAGCLACGRAGGLRSDGVLVPLFDIVGLEG